MFANPIIRRYRFSQLRPQQVWVFGSLYVCIVLLILFINSSIYRYGDGAYETLTELYKGLFVQLAILELFLLWLLCPANCSNVVSREIADKSFDFFRMLPVSAGQKAVGILAGRNLFCLLAAAINLGLCLVFGFAAELSTGLIVQMLAVLAALTVTLNLLALLFSVLTYKKSKVTSIPVLLVIGLFAFGPVMGMLFASVADNQDIETTTAFFYTLEMPVLYLIAFCALCLSVWAYIGVLRRFTYEYEALFNRVGATLFTLSFIAILFGLFYSQFYLRGQGNFEPEFYSKNTYVDAFWIFGLLPVAVVPMFSIRGFDKSLEISRASHRSEGLVVRLLICSNIVGGLILYAIWLAFAVAAGITTGADMIELFWLAIMVLSFYLVILALVETYAMWQPKNEKIGYLLGFIAILYFVLPFVLSAIFDNELLCLFSPLGVAEIFEDSQPVINLLMPLFFNLFCLLPLGLLIGKRYSDLASIRMEISKQSAIAG